VGQWFYDDEGGCEMRTDAGTPRVSGSFYRGLLFGLLFSLLFWVPLGVLVYFLV
jgi:hypothetical protein